MIFTLFIPIGFLGTQGVSTFNYPGIAATDCISLEAGLVERTMMIYLLVYLLTATLNIIVHWHVSLELIKGLFQSQFNFKETKTITWFILIFFGIIPFILVKVIPNEITIFSISIQWLTLRLFIEPFMTIIMILAAYIAKKKGLI
jgi:hypothetical protein